ncbi:MAG: UDP-glucose 4-epimerase [Thermoanaerobaculia bacterium]|nr:UDP-glucose 4-epimerase [Thermoanaerobaculia bacterium]
MSFWVSGRRVLVTGGLGFIGSNLVRKLLDLGAKVRVVDCLRSGDGGNRFNLKDVDGQYELIDGSLEHRAVTETAVDGCDVVFHMAGKVSHIDSLARPLEDLIDNAATTVAILDACRRLNPSARIVIAGTRQVYGTPLRLPVSEDHPLRPPDFNAVSKIAAEYYARVASERLGLSTLVLRLTNVYGPRQLVSHSRASFTGWFIRQALLGETIDLFGSGLQYRDLLYVDDAVNAFILAAEKLPGNGEAWNCGTEEPVSLAEFAEMLVRLAGTGEVRRIPFPPERKQIDIGDFSTDSSRLRAVTGWNPRIGLEEGLRRTVEFYRLFGDHYWSATS